MHNEYVPTDLSEGSLKKAARDYIHGYLERYSKASCVFFRACGVTYFGAMEDILFNGMDGLQHSMVVIEYDPVSVRHLAIFIQHCGHLTWIGIESVLDANGRSALSVDPTDKRRLYASFGFKGLGCLDREQTDYISKHPNLSLTERVRNHSVQRM